MNIPADDSDARRRYLEQHPLLQALPQDGGDAQGGEGPKLASKQGAGRREIKQGGVDAPSTFPPVVDAFAMFLNHLVYLSELTPRAQPTDFLSKPLAAFESSEVPNISIKEYVERVYTYSSMSPACYVIAYCWLKTIAEGGGLQGPAGSNNVGSASRISAFNIHRLAFLALVSAAKFVDDVYYQQGFYASIGGITTQELNFLEREFLYLLDYKLFISTEDFACSLMELELELELSSAR
mmetsp:Transcript_33001/g.71253  ORF Transcript_33001/g.71253 Transcript_33001/m.71253 type:complete len:238 (+) Transcript_33001:104-817(+)